MRTASFVIGFAIALAALAALALWQPVAASRVIWPAVEGVMLREPFRGITTNGSARPDLFPIAATGVATTGIVAAADTLIASLDPAQRKQLLFSVDDKEWRRWANIHISTRQGVGLLDMQTNQQTAAMNLVRASLSAKGFATASDIMHLEGHLADLKNDYSQYGEKRYWFTIMGQPSATEPWGWQIDGHHLVINLFVLGDQVVMTPTFMGSEPTQALTGRYQGTAILEQELEAGLALINALDTEQQKQAILDHNKTANNNLGELFQDNAVVPYQGINLSALAPAQRELAVILIRHYVGNLPADHASVKMAEVARHWHNTWFVWVGGTADNSVFYYRIHSPVIMIEYDHQLPVALDGPDLPSRQHVHTVVRTPNGNDYGKDLLRQHLMSHPHGVSGLD